MAANSWRRSHPRKAPSYHLQGEVRPSWTVLLLLCMSLCALWSICFVL